MDIDKHPPKPEELISLPDEPIATNYPRRSRPGKSLKKEGDQAPRWAITATILGEIALLVVLLWVLTFGPWYLVDRLYHLSLPQEESCQIN